MRRSLILLLSILTSVLIAGCGSSGHAVDPPVNGVTLVAGDGIITATWAMEPGVNYWMFYAPSYSISTSNWTTTHGSLSAINTTSPFIASGLTNDSVYSFTVDGRTNGGPGGAGTPSVFAFPRLAGTATATLPAPWTPGTAIGAGANDLFGLAWGKTLVAVGAGGVVYSSPDGVAWTQNTSPAVAGNIGNLNAATFAGVYNAVGDGGVILYSADAITWTAATGSATVTTNRLNGIAGGIGRIVTVGAGGTILYSADGMNWTEAISSRTVTTNDLYAVQSYGGLWIAVGAKDPVTKQGTLLTSTDNATTWTSVSSNTPYDLKGVTWGKDATTGTLIFVAVGASGALVTSPDAITWTAQAAIGANTLNAVTAVVRGTFQTCGTQFVAVGDGGSIYTSTDAINWASQPSTTKVKLSAVVHATYSYEAVGAAGVNLLAK